MMNGAHSATGLLAGVGIAVAADASPAALALAALVGAGAADPHRPVAAGLVGLTWALTSILVLHRGGTRQPQHITVNTQP